MKKWFNKRVYRESLRQTGILRFVFPALMLLVSVGLCVGGDEADEDLYALGIYEFPEAYIAGVCLMIILLLIGDLMIQRRHRSKKCEGFHTLPASKKEWFDATFLAQMTNLLVYTVFTEVITILVKTVFLRMRGGIGLIDGFPQQLDPEVHLRRAVLMIVIGFVFSATLAVIRELTHSGKTFLLLFVAVYVQFWGFFLTLPALVSGLSANRIDTFSMFIYQRLRLLFSLFLFLDDYGDPTMRVACDWIAVSLNILIGIGLFLLARRLSGKSRAEYVEADYRNKCLFYVFLVLLNTVPFWVIGYEAAIRKFSVITVVTTPLYMILTTYLLFRLFRMKLQVKTFGWMIIPVSAVALVFGALYWYVSAHLKLPAREDVVGIAGGYNWKGDLCTWENGREEMTDLYEWLQQYLSTPHWEQESKDAFLTVYTKTGSTSYTYNWRSYENYQAAKTKAAYAGDEDSAEKRHEEMLNRSTDEVVPSIMLRYKKEPAILTEFASEEEYEHFLTLLPENMKREAPVYYINALGGLSKSKETFTVSHKALVHRTWEEYLNDTDTHCASIGLFLVNGGYDDATEYPVGSEAERYYHEKVSYRWRDRYRDRYLKNTDSYSLRITFWHNTFEHPLTLKCSNGKVSVEGPKGMVFSAEMSERFYQEIFCKEPPKDIPESWTSVQVNAETPIGSETWTVDAYPGISFYVPKEVLDPFIEEARKYLAGLSETQPQETEERGNAQ